MFPSKGTIDPYANIKAKDSQDFQIIGAEDELTDDQISELYGDVKILLDPGKYYDPKTMLPDLPSLFPFDEPAHLVIIVPEPLQTYEVQTNVGTATKKKAGHQFYFEDSVTFRIDTEASLQYLPIGQPGFRWLGNDDNPPTVSIEGKKVTLNRPYLGTLEVFYNIQCDQWDVELTSAQAAAWTGLTEAELIKKNRVIEVVTVAKQGEKKDSIGLDFAPAETVEWKPTPPTNYTIVYENKCKPGVIMPGGINVSFNGISGQTDSNGEFFVGLLGTGSYSHRAFKTGEIIDTKDDKLNNDIVVIP